MLSAVESSEADIFPARKSLKINQLCVSELETTWYNLILSFLQNSNFNTYFRPEIVKLSNCYLTVLNVFTDFFFQFVSGLETSWYILILSFLWISNFTPAWDYEPF